MSRSVSSVSFWPPLQNRSQLREWVDSRQVQGVVIATIILNAVILGLETSRSLTESYGHILHGADTACLVVFVIELALKLYAYGRSFWKSGWNIFDAIIVVIALVPGSGPFSVLRGFRILRVFRLVSAFPKLRFVVEALMSAVPGMASIGALLSIIFYVCAVMACTLFGESHPEWFGTLGRSLYTLFQVMTLESWSMGIVRPVMSEQPWAWLFFVPFILLSSFAVLNLFIAVIVDSMQTLTEGSEESPVSSSPPAASGSHVDGAPLSTDAGNADSLDSRDQIAAELAAMRAELAEVKSLLTQQR